MRIDQTYTLVASTWQQASGSDVSVRESEVGGGASIG